MIRIYGIATDGLSEQSLIKDLKPQLRVIWELHHKGMKQETSRVSSLAAVYLLSKTAPDGVLLYPDNGKPIYATENGVELAISITHTKTHTFLAISDQNSPIGLDAEDLGRGISDNIPKMAARWFRPSEQARLDRTPDEETFLRIWTRKEALVKRSGEGLQALRATDSEAVNGVSFSEFQINGTLLTLVCDTDESIAEPTILTV